MSSVHDWVSYHATRRPNAPAVTSVERGVTVTWGELERRVARLAYVLRHELGLATRDRVATIAENDTRTFELQFACMRAGLILVPINWRLALGEMTALMRDAEPKAIFYDDAWREIGETVADAAGIAHRIWWSDAGSEGTYEQMLARGDGGLPGVLHDESDVTHILYTSGTTGLPKGATCTRASLIGHALNMAQTSRHAEHGNNHLNIAPLFHAGGLNTFSNPILFWGGHVTTVRRFDPAVTLRLLTDPKVGITHMCGVLQMYEMITALPEFEKAVFPALKAALFGGWGPQTKSVHEAWRARGFFLQLSYGSTECGPIVSILESGNELASKNCSGNTVSGTQLRLVDSGGQDVKRGEVGEIWVQGKAITPGYWQRPRADYFSGDWFKTGDCGRLDEGGRLYIVDRLREVYRSGGENVYPAEVELALSQTPGVKEIAVIAVPDQKWGEVGLAIIEPIEGASVTLESLLAHADGKLARYKQPKYAVAIAEMPRNATLKIDRTALKKAYGGAPPIAAAS